MTNKKRLWILMRARWGTWEGMVGGKGKRKMRYLYYNLKNFFKTIYQNGSQELVQASDEKRGLKHINFVKKIYWLN